MAKTLSHASELDDARSGRPAPQLYLAMAHAPLDSPMRFHLDGIDEVSIGRGDDRVFARQGRRLAVALPDPWLSTSHALFSKVLGRWTLEDLGSKNGSRINASRIDRQVLGDADIIELGRSYFVFRGQVLPETDAGAMAAIHSAAGAPAPGLATLVPGLAASFDRLRRIAASAVSIVLHGESGTGKEVVAQAAHTLSGRSGEIVALNCGALPEALVASELFGHKKGAFSGAVDDRPGLIRAAHGGTLFLDEIADLPLAAQATLLRVLQEQEVLPLGAARPVPVDIRVICATHKDLTQLVEQGQFRQDLFTRLCGFRLVIPPLRERREDLGLIAAAILRRLAGDRAASVRFEPKAARALFAHDWPGNVRELEKTLGAALVLAGDGAIQLEHLGEELQGSAGAPQGGAPEDDARRVELIALLQEHRGNVSAIARALGKAPVQIRRWLKRYGLDADRFR